METIFSLPADLSLKELQSQISKHPLASSLPPLEQRLLLAHALGLDRVGLITQDQRIINQAQTEQVCALLARRLAGEPVAYILGHREFFGLSLKVTPDVLIPRPDTELLVELAQELAPNQAKVADLGTGSGAIAIALASQRPDLHIWALDASQAALDVARSNAQSLLPKPITFICSDWYQALPSDLVFDLIVSNPPYIQAQDQHLSEGDLRFEPINALTDHADGLQAIRQIIADAPAHLRAGGRLLLEHGYDQAAQVRDLLRAQGWLEAQSWRDLAGIERVSGAYLPTKLV